VTRLSRRTSRPLLDVAVVALALLSAGWPLDAHADRLVAITIDDLPFLGEPGPGDSVVSATERILQALAKFKAPATAFVSCQRSPENIKVLEKWMKAGVVLGNHTKSHKSLDDLSDADWERDVTSCAETIKAEIHASPRYFRFPFLQSGKTAERRAWALRRLEALGYVVAPVTIDTSDWIAARAYQAALGAHDRQAREEAGRVFLEHVIAATEHYRSVAEARIGRDVAHVLLLHASALLADNLGALLERLTQMGFRFIGLAEALADPVYAMPDAYAGSIGMSWLYRVGVTPKEGRGPADPEGWGWDVGQGRAMGERLGVAGEGLEQGRALRIGRDLLVRKLDPKLLVIVHEKPWAANSMMAEMPDGTLIFAGSPYTPEATHRLLDWTQMRYGPRKIVAIATHFHFDAAGGISAWKQAGARVIASDLTAEALTKHGKTMWKTMVGFLEKDPEQAARFNGLEVPVPSETFHASEGMKLLFGHETVELRYPGPGHTNDNIVVWFPARGALFGGCLVIGMDRIGYTGDADLDRWPQTIKSLISLRPSTVVPGHGERFGPDLLDHTLTLLATPH
jgi:metallo-beta-lactamase class B